MDVWKEEHLKEGYSVAQEQPIERKTGMSQQIKEESQDSASGDLKKAAL